MQVIGEYGNSGFAWVQQLVPREVAQAFMARLRQDMGPNPIPLSSMKQFPNLLARPAFELYGRHYPPMQFFLWGLTPIVSEIVGRELLPTYDYLRIYREGDVCRVHCDRYACEHSLSLTLDYSDGVPWSLDVATEPSPPSALVEPDFGGRPFDSVPMQVGDAVLYRGVDHRHGRIARNPNGWSAHLFLHWVDRHGPHADQAFDGQKHADAVNFNFA